MTDTWNSAQKANRLTAATVHVVVYSMFCHNHLRNVWVKNMLEYLTEFLRAHLNDILNKVAPEFCVTTGFMSLACTLKKMLSLCAKYPKGLGEVFRQWIMDNHYGELLFHEEIEEYCGRQDVTSMAAIAIFWNRTTVLSSCMRWSDVAERLKTSLHAI